MRRSTKGWESGADGTVSFAKFGAGQATVDSGCVERQNRRVLETIVVVVRALALACRGHHELVLENLALRQQLAALRRTVARPHLRRRDRLFWIVLSKTWRRWRAALVVVQPDTVVRWHREWRRRR